MKQEELKPWMVAYYSIDLFGKEATTRLYFDEEAAAEAFARSVLKVERETGKARLICWGLNSNRYTI